MVDRREPQICLASNDLETLEEAAAALEGCPDEEVALAIAARLRAMLARADVG